MAVSVLRIVTENTSVCMGDEFIAHVFVDAPDSAVNAAQGVLSYDPMHLTPVAIRYGDSFLRYWVTAPALPETPGTIPFTGGLPFPGFQGRDGKVMSVVFRAESANVHTELTLSRDAQILLNDGNGTSTDILYEDRTLALVEREAVMCQVGPAREIIDTDTTPPLPFDIIIERSEKIFNGNYFAAFDTTDSESGVAYYEVRESSPFIQTPWLKVSSPYELRTQGGDVHLIVRAVDGAGNERLASVSHDLPVSQPAFGYMGMMAIASAIVASITIWIFCKRRNKKQ